MTVAGGVAAADLMDRAGQAVADAIFKRWSPLPVVVLCGPGNNGGDGFVVARQLKAAGWPVRVAAMGSKHQRPAAAAEQARRWDGDLLALTPAAIDAAGLVVDAVFGAGFSVGPGSRTARADRVDSQPAATLRAGAARGLPIVAIDLPSGVDADTGAGSDAVAATLTVTFFRKKPGHLLQPGRQLCGEVEVADIGIDAGLLETLQPTCFENHPELWRSAWPAGAADSHKFMRGHALVWGGWPLSGAARLAARAAARMGAGLTTVAVDSHGGDTALAVYASSLLSIMPRPVADAPALQRLLDDPRINALLIGPGAGTASHVRQAVLAFLASRRPTVLDADALNAFADAPAQLWQAIGAAGPCVLTPHEGEFSRLFDDRGDKVSRARQAARLAAAVLVLKGSDTVIAAPDGRSVINANAPPRLATAGAGDVLAGFITGLLAQGMPAFEAACAAVWLHGAAAQRFGPGLIADDLPEWLPGVLAETGLGC